MKKIEHTPFIWQYLDVADAIEEIRDKCLEYCHYDYRVHPRPRTDSVRNDSYNITELARIYPDLIRRQRVYELDQRLTNIYEKVQHDYCKDNELFKYTLSASNANRASSKFTFRNYEKGDEYDYHVDLYEFGRFILSGILYLNDDFEGGGTNYMMDKITVEPVKNSLLMCPCGPYFIHSSVPIVKGTKNIIWSCFNREVQGSL